MPANNDTDATHILAADHRKVEELFAEYESSSNSSRKTEIAHRICQELKVHAQVEEEIFYPALQGKIEEDLLKEAYVEHDGAKLLINELAEGEAGDENYDAKVKVLKEQIEHHVKEEEKQNENMFQQARAADVDLEALGEQLLRRKQELMSKAEQVGLPPAEMSTIG